MSASFASVINSIASSTRSFLESLGSCPRNTASRFVKRIKTFLNAANASPSTLTTNQSKGTKIVNNWNNSLQRFVAQAGFGSTLQGFQPEHREVCASRLDKGCPTPAWLVGMLFTVAIAAAVCAGCVAPAKMNTASGRPEVIVTGKTTDQIQAKLANELVNQGYAVRTDSLNVVAEKEVKDVASRLVFGSRYDSRVFMRSTFTILEQGDGTHRIVGAFAAVTNTGSAFERQEEMGVQYESMQQFLSGIAW